MSIKKEIWKQMEEKGHILDCDLDKIFGDKEVNFRTAESYKMEWYAFQNDKARFEKEKIIEKYHPKGKYLIRLEGMPAGTFYRVGKEFYNSIKIIK